MPGFFIAAFLIASILTWQGQISVLPMMGMVSGTIAFWQKEARLVRLIGILSPPLWFTYNIIVGSYPGMITEVIILSSNLIGVYRFDRQK